jgi:hypothetical protein
VRVSKSAKPTKSDMLAATPVRSDGATEKPAGPGKWNLTIPVRPTRWASVLLRIPGGMKKTFELDELGKFVWDACDGRTSVRQVIRKLAKRYNLNEREAEVATVAFLQTLTRKGLIAMAVEK